MAMQSRFGMLISVGNDYGGLVVLCGNFQPCRWQIMICMV